MFFEIPKAVVDPDKRQHTGLQHVAFECTTLDDLLGTYVRLKGLGITPLWAADHGVGTSFYWEDPDRNVVEIYVNNFGSPWTATEFLKSGHAGIPAQIDPEKLVAARKNRRIALGIARAYQNSLSGPPPLEINVNAFHSLSRAAREDEHF